jgi:hypothetical protein
MRVIGFNFDKISVERHKEKAENIKITTNIDVFDIKETKSEIIKTKEELIHAKFSYGIKYEPGFATIDLKGNLLLSLPENEAKEVLKEWKKKAMPEDFKLAIFNIVLRKSSLKALYLEEEMNLPLHMPLPHFNAQKEK